MNCGRTLDGTFENTRYTLYYLRYKSIVTRTTQIFMNVGHLKLLENGPQALADTLSVEQDGSTLSEALGISKLRLSHLTCR